MASSTQAHLAAFPPPTEIGMIVGDCDGLNPAACQALGVAPRSAVAREDSGAGSRAARSAEPHPVTMATLTGQERDHDRLPDSPATPGPLQAWARAPHPAGSRAAG